MVDAEDAVLGEGVADLGIHRARRGEIVTDRLFHRDAAVGASDVRAFKPLRDRAEHRWRGRKIGADRAAEAIAELRREFVIAGARARIDRTIIDAAQEAGDLPIVEPVVGQMVGERLAYHRMAAVAIHFRPPRRDDRQRIFEQPVDMKIVERGEEHALRKIARCAEQDQGFDFHAHYSPLGWSFRIGGCTPRMQRAYVSRIRRRELGKSGNAAIGKNDARQRPPL